LKSRSCSRPRGDHEESLRAAVAAGADAVYFGLRGGFNARARADNFAAADLPRIFEFLHSKGVQGIRHLNTLVFDRELPVAEEALAGHRPRGGRRRHHRAGPRDRAGWARQVCPELPLHASTQMTISSAEAAAIAQTLGVTRVVLPRELSIEEIRADVRPHRPRAGVLRPRRALRQLERTVPDQRGAPAP